MCTRILCRLLAQVGGAAPLDSGEQIREEALAAVEAAGAVHSRSSHQQAQTANGRNVHSVIRLVQFGIIKLLSNFGTTSFII